MNLVDNRQEKEKEVNDKHGRPTRPPPERPTPSDIGTGECLLEFSWHDVPI